MRVEIEPEELEAIEVLLAFTTTRVKTRANRDHLADIASSFLKRYCTSAARFIERVDPSQKARLVEVLKWAD